MIPTSVGMIVVFLAIVLLCVKHCGRGHGNRAHSDHKSDNPADPAGSFCPCNRHDSGLRFLCNAELPPPYAHSSLSLKVCDRIDIASTPDRLS